MMRLIFAICLLYAIPGFAQHRPNIIYIMSDDHDNDAISAYNRSFIQTPNIDRLAAEGMRFNKAFVGNSICAPARATLLTGQHSHKNGVKDNRTPFDTTKTTLAHLLQRNGYETALVGKWHLHSLPQGFDYWRILPGMGQYFDTRMITMQRDTITEKGYATDVLTDDMLDWLSTRKSNKPFALFFHHKAPHRYFFPNIQHLRTFSQRRFPEPGTLHADTLGRGEAWKRQTMNILADMKLCSDLKIDPGYLENIPTLKPDKEERDYYAAIMRRVPAHLRKEYEEIYAQRGRIMRDQQPTGNALMSYKYQWYMQDYLACIASVDESIGRLLDYLDSNKLTANTAVIYTSDQGFYLGENGWFDKRFAYDVSMQTPLLVRWPGKIKQGTVNNALVQNIDFAPTILGMAGIKAPADMQGIDLSPLMRGITSKTSRDYLYYHYYEYVKDHTVLPHLALRGNKYKLIYFYTVDEWEFYDLLKDPGEQKNLINDPRQQATIGRLRKELIRLRNKYEDLEPAGKL